MSPLVKLAVYLSEINVLKSKCGGESVTLITSNNINVQAMYFNALKRPQALIKEDEECIVKNQSEKGPTVLFFAGSDTSVFDESYESTIRSYLERGINVMVLDYPGVGNSKGYFSVRNSYEAAEAAFTFVKEKGVPENKILIEGFSMGSGPATYIAAHHKGVNLLLRNPFIKMSEIGREVFVDRPTKYFRHLLPKIIGLISQFALPFNNTKLMEHVKGPVAVLTAGDNDMYNIRLHTQERLKSAFFKSNENKNILFLDLPANEALRGVVSTDPHLLTYDNKELAGRLDTFLRKIHFFD